MSDPQPSPKTPEATPASKSRRLQRFVPPWWLWLLLILLAALLLAGWFGWRGWQVVQANQQARQDQVQDLHTQLQQLRDQQQSLRTDLGKASDSAQQDRQDLSGLQTRVQDLERNVGNLNGAVRGGRERVQLDVVEQLLLTANEDVQLSHDPLTARRALEVADNRLAALESPRLFDLRKAISQERAALRNVDEPDLTAAALSLSQLIESVPELPLRAQPHALAVPAPPAAGDNTQGGFSRGWHRIVSALRSLFHLRRTDRPIEPLLTQAQAPLIGEVLTLRLDTARAALIRRDGKTYQATLDSARQWLKRYYRADDPGVSGSLDEMIKLAVLNLDPPLPDISHSLDLLRALRDARPDTQSGSGPNTGSN